LETARIKADLINSLLSGESYNSMILKLKGGDAETYASRYKEAIKPKVIAYGRNFVDASLMKMIVYRDIAADLINNSTDAKLAQPIKDWYKAEELVGEMEKAKNKSELAKFKEKITQIKTIPYQRAANQMLQQLLSFGKGDEAVDFIARDLNGLPVKLSSLKGKVIYVDLWATWCGPCMHEMPYFEKLKIQYKDNPDIAFVSLSLDDTVEVWKKSVESRKAEGQQWLIDRNKLQAYNIVGIPRILLIDKNFKMADMDAPAPSSAEAVKAINQLL
jgi:thiol-disulfide isomerase/thioredoxin